MILLIDFGSQTAHLIARRLRELGAQVVIALPEETTKVIKQHKPDGIILSGSPKYLNKKNAPRIPKKVLLMGIPTLGICYGHQLMAHLLGGAAGEAKVKEYGPAILNIVNESPLFSLPVSHFQVWMSHGHEVQQEAPGFVCIARTDTGAHAAVANQQRKLYGIQFHPEVVHTKYGTDILHNFLLLCGLRSRKRSITTRTVDQMVTAIRDDIGGKRAVCGLSGGIDSATAAVLVHRAIGKNLTCVYVDSGLMRAGETEEIKKTFGKYFKLNLVVVDAKREFLSALSGVTDPEQKRLIIGEQFIRVFEREAKKLRATFLVQGTIYPDVIESQGSKHADKIKSHHNVGGLPKNMKLHLIEPLRNLYKDEVRLIAAILKFPKHMTTRQPFPGPGLAIRIIGEVTEERLEIVRKADAIVREEIIKAKLWDKTWQAFAVLTGARSTGVRGDERSYGETIAVRVVEAVDAMTAHWSRLPYGLLDKISTRIVNEIADINRVVYDITNKPPATMEWE